MKITVTGKNISVTDKIQESIEKKFQKIEKYFSDETQAKVVMRPERDKVKLEATISAKGTVFRAEDVQQDIMECIDNVADRLITQMSKYKKKLIKRNQSKESVRFEMIPEIDNAVEPVETKPVKTKKFQLTPMSTDEAILRMELIQHNFFLFLNEETGKVNVVYKRNDNAYGLLETE